MLPEGYKLKQSQEFWLMPTVKSVQEDCGKWSQRLVNETRNRHVPRVWNQEKLSVGV